MKVVIIGAVAGGASAAARLRRLDESARIVVIERTGYMSYANCGLPYYIGGVIEDESELTLQTPESFRNRFNVEVRVHSEALGIDVEKKVVLVRSLRDGREYEEPYDKLILSPGAKPVRPDIAGIDGKRIFVLRNVEDTLRLRRFIDTHKPRRAVVAGGGFIGLEMVENLSGSGVETTLVEMADQVLLPLDADMACSAHALLRGRGVRLILGSPVSGFEETENGIKTFVGGSEPIASDFVVLGLGVVPDSSLAVSAGLRLGMKGSIVVDEHMRTSNKDIYAVGDAVEVVHSVSGLKTVVSLAGPANRQGRIAADNICGINSSYTGSQGTTILKLFDMSFAATGLNERAAADAGIKYDKIVIGPPSHATYFPGAKNMTMKVLFRPDSGVILGAQITGFEGVDKRIDVLATAIRAGMTGSDLAALDLAYAPPYSSAKDPVNVAGCVIENLMTGKVRQCHWHDPAFRHRPADCVFLDVRDEDEFSEGNIDGAVNIPLDELRGRLGELDRSKRIYVNCQTALRSYIACRILAQHGFDCVNVSGGYGFWSSVKRGSSAGSPAHACGKKL